MLMLQRSEEGTTAKVDCDDAAIAVACALDSDKCPAECKEGAKDEEKEDTIVKSGSLVVKATAATEKKAILDGGVSDLDTITLKASEKITVNSITLERFGYSTANDVASLWLEDEDGNKIADEKSLSTSKDTVTLKIKKEYRDMDETNTITIVLKTAEFDNNNCYDAGCTKKAGSTIGFKVVDVESSAKDLDKSDYDPYTYDLTSYDGSKVTLSVKGNDKTYNYEEGEYYEVSRVKVKAGASILALNGITLTNKGGKVTYSKDAVAGACPAAEAGYTADADNDAANNKCNYTADTALTIFDLDEFVSGVKVTADGKEVKGLKYNVTKDNELVLSWDTIEVAINKDVQLIVSIAMEDLDTFGNVVRLVLDEQGDLNATEKKTGARVTVAAPKASDNSWKVYTFNGSKIKFTNTKLSSTIDAAQGSEDVTIAKGKVTVAEEVKVKELKFKADNAGIIEDMTLVVGGESYDASVDANKEYFTFTNVIFEKSSDVELNVDVIDEEDALAEEVQISVGGKVSIGKEIFDGNNGRYETSRKDVDKADVSGSITISKLKIQESKGSFTNKSTTKKNVVKNESKEVEVFNGTYTAKKGAILLDNVKIVKKSGAAAGDDISFKVTIDGKDVADIDNPTAAGDDEDFDAIEVAGGESVDVKVVATAYAEDESTQDFEYTITLSGKDDKGNDAGTATKTMAKIAFVGADKITVSSSSSAKKQDVILASDNQVVSWFVVEPEKKASDATIDDVEFFIGDFYAILTDLNNGETDPTKWSDPDNFFEFAIGSETADDMSFAGADENDLTLVIADMGAKISKASDAKLTFTETLKCVDSDGNNDGDEYDTVLLSVNGEPQNGKDFYRLVVNSLVTVSTQTKEDGETEYTFEIEYSDDAVNKSIDYVEFTYDTVDAAGDDYALFQDVTEGKNGYTAKNIKDSPRYVAYIEWEDGDGQTIQLDYNVYTDFFKVGGKRIQTFANS